jgi:SAM-dependent methyltransferase
MEYTPQKYFVPWSTVNYGLKSLPGAVTRHEVLLDGWESAHLGAGWHEHEQGFRWTKQHATAYLLRHNGQNKLEVELSSGVAALGPVTVTVAASGRQVTRTLSNDAWQVLRLHLPPIEGEMRVQSVSISVDRVRKASDDPRELGVAVRAIRLIGKPKTSDLALNSVCNPDHWEHPFWISCLDELSFQNDRAIIKRFVRHRKVWEYVHCAAGLKRLGVLKPMTIALGVAAGHEPIIYWLANRVARVYATDLYRGVFSQQEADPAVLHDPDRFAPYPYPRERVHFFPMDGCNFALHDESVDVIFSLCSIEHFGSRANSLQSLREMYRVLRPGGVAVISTEVLLNDTPPQAEIFSPWELYEELIGPSGLLMIGDIAPANLARYYNKPVDITNPAMLAAAPEIYVLNLDICRFTSVMFFLQKP